MNDPLLPDGLRVPAERGRVPAKRGAEALRDRHLSTSAERHERWLVRWSWVRTPVAFVAGIIWIELSWLLGSRVWDLILVEAPTDEIELSVAGIFAAWMALTTGIFRVLRPQMPPSEPHQDGASENEAQRRSAETTAVSGSMDPSLQRALLVIARSDDSVSAEDLARTLGDTSLRAEYYIEKLEDADLIYEAYADGYVVSPQGRAYVVEHNLDR